MLIMLEAMVMSQKSRSQGGNAWLASMVNRALSACTNARYALPAEHPCIHARAANQYSCGPYTHCSADAS